MKLHQADASRLLLPPLPTGVKNADRSKRFPLPRILFGMFAVLGLLMLVPAPARAQHVEWTQRAVSGPSSRANHAMAYDSARGVAVLFGGVDFNGENDETWEWNGTTWTQQLVSGPSRHQHAMAYDSARGVTVLFGLSQTASNGETWEWNGTAWTQRVVSGPARRYSHAMAYDSARGVTVLFGGFDPTSGRTGDTWEWDGTAWTERVVSGPSARNNHAMAYDAARGVTVLFGGNTGTFDSETWEWNGTAWTRRFVSSPSARQYHAMAYDASRGVCVLFGGSDGGGNTWEWNGTTWTQRMVSGPSPRSNHAMAYDSVRGMIVLFGGYASGSVPNGETWEFCAVDITAQPAAQAVCPSGSASFSLTTAGTGPFTYQWQIEDSASPGMWLGITDGVNSPPGWQFTASGAATPMLQTGTYHPTSHVAQFRCIVTNDCGSVTSDEATLTVIDCPADFNCDGFANSQDFFDFLAAFFALEPAADFNHDTFINSQDFFDFLAAFFTGCG